jgi:hypothetical protein
MTSTTGGRRMSRAEVIERARGIAAAVAPHVERPSSCAACRPRTSKR